MRNYQDREEKLIILCFTQLVLDARKGFIQNINIARSVFLK